MDNANTIKCETCRGRGTVLREQQDDDGYIGIYYPEDCEACGGTGREPAEPEAVQVIIRDRVRMGEVL